MLMFISIFLVLEDTMDVTDSEHIFLAGEVSIFFTCLNANDMTVITRLNMQFELMHVSDFNNYHTFLQTFL